MEKWIHHINNIQRRHPDNGRRAYIVDGHTEDKKTEKRIEWKFVIDSDGDLIESHPFYIEKLYTATKLKECMKKYWSNERQVQFLYRKFDTNFTCIVDAEGESKRIDC